MTTTNGDMPALRALVLKAAVEHLAPSWGRVPGVGRSGAARYIWEAAVLHMNGGTNADHEWIVSYLAEHPEVFDRPNPTGSFWQRCRELSADADQRALAAWQAGDWDAAEKAIDEAEALHPQPGNSYTDARKLVHAARQADTGQAES